MLRIAVPNKGSRRGRTIETFKAEHDCRFVDDLCDLIQGICTSAGIEFLGKGLSHAVVGNEP